MFGDNFLSNNFFEILSLLVTIVGIWLVVSQLRQSRIAAQMEGIMQLGDRFTSILPEISILSELANTEEWQTLNGIEVYSRIFDSGDIELAFSKMGVFYEQLGLLVRRGAVHIDIAYQFFGAQSAARWRWVEKAVFVQREKIGNETFLEHFEWLINKFEKLSE